jgi:hypothetical protein
MKLGSSRHASFVAGLAVFSILVSNSTFDHITVSTRQVTKTFCPAGPILIEQSPSCYPVNYTEAKTGRPFLTLLSYKSAVTAANSNNTLYAISLTHDDSIVVSANAALIFFTLLALYAVYRRHQAVTDELVQDLMYATADIDNPLIASSDLLNEPDVQAVVHGTLNGYHYTMLTNDKDRMMLSITLPSSTNMHIIAIGSNSDLSSPLSEHIDKKFLEKINLEGDFPDHFRLYCSYGRELEVRQLLDPSTMAFLVDYCQNYDLELFMDSLFISQAAQATNSDNGNPIIENTEQLLRHFDLTLQSFMSQVPHGIVARDASVTVE